MMESLEAISVPLIIAGVVFTLFWLLFFERNEATYMYLATCFVLIVTGVVLFTVSQIYAAKSPSIEEAPYKIGSYYADSYELQSGSIVLDDYWYHGKYHDATLVILEDYVSIEDRRD